MVIDAIECTATHFMTIIGRLDERRSRIYKLSDFETLENNRKLNGDNIKAFKVNQIKSLISVKVKT